MHQNVGFDERAGERPGGAKAIRVRKSKGAGIGFHGGEVSGDEPGLEKDEPRVQGILVSTSRPNATGRRYYRYRQPATAKQGVK